VGQQFSFARPALEVQAQHLEGALARFVAGPLDDQQTGDQSQVDLNGDAIVAGREQMLAAEDALEPAKEEFRLPAIMPPKREAYI
jgi:hypothetical protein